MGIFKQILMTLALGVTYIVTAQAAPQALVLDIQGAIGPSVAEDVQRVLDRAQKTETRLIVNHELNYLSSSLPLKRKSNSDLYES